MKPKFVHDCSDCKFLGHVVISKIEADIYVCLAKNDIVREQRLLLWRRSDKEGDYGSSPAEHVTPLSPFAMVALSLYSKHLDIIECSLITWRGDNTGYITVLNLNKTK